MNRRTYKKTPLQRKLSSKEIAQKAMKQHPKELLKNPVIKGIAIVGTVYGVLFISKFIIKEYAAVVLATKKLRDAYRH